MRAAGRRLREVRLRGRPGGRQPCGQLPLGRVLRDGCEHRPHSLSAHYARSHRVRKAWPMPGGDVIACRLDSVSVVLAFFVFLELHLPTLIEHAHRLVDDRPRSSLN